jgi:hypothetical protein
MNKRHQSFRLPTEPYQTQKARYRVSNWPEYNASLVQRGSITLWINSEDLGSWKPADDPKRGGQRQYSDGAIQCLLMVRSFFRLPLRATEGFVRSVFELMHLELAVPDYSTICKRSKDLAVVWPRQAKGPLHAVLDSTGLKVFGEGEWKVRQHGHSRRGTWRKLHLSVDSATQEVQAVVLSAARLDDAQAVPDLLDQMEAPVAQLSGDGAYDKRKVYLACQERGITRVTIPPRKDARPWKQGKGLVAPLVRNANLRQIHQVGRQRWKQESGYHQRSLAETAMFRFKTLFGPGLRSRKMPQQQTEARVKCVAMNRVTHLGMPLSFRVA